VSAQTNRYEPGIERCAFTGKERFETKEVAARALSEWAYAKGSRRVQRRCPGCWGFHLTKGQRGPKMRKW
jgi:hypothetical protein